VRKGVLLMKILIRNQTGISLLEVMVGMLIFSLGMLLMIPMVATSITGNETSRYTDRMMEDVQNIVEAYKAGALPDWGMEYDMQNYRHVMWWTTDTEPPTANMKVLVVELMWEDTNAQYHFQQFKTYIYRRT
jgi:Tfp pilus assembly protein PilV